MQQVLFLFDLECACVVRVCFSLRRERDIISAQNRKPGRFQKPGRPIRILFQDLLFVFVLECACVVPVCFCCQARTLRSSLLRRTYDEHGRRSVPKNQIEAAVPMVIVLDEPFDEHGVYVAMSGLFMTYAELQMSYACRGWGSWISLVPLLC